MRFIGIDPGKGGAIAVLNEGAVIVEVLKMPDNTLELFEFLKRQASSGRSLRAALEFVRSSPAMGVVSAFTFGRGLGAIEMGLTAAAMPYYEVHPRRWQKALGCLSRGDKNVTKARAVELWPAHKVTHAIADALLLAEWCRRKHVGLIVESETEGVTR